MMVTDFTENTTPIDPDEMDGLKLSHITTRQELNRWEQDNILEAFNWMELQKPDILLTEKFIMELHRRMFGKVWIWAGSYRKTNKNIGIEWWRIPVELKKLLDDTAYWISKDTYEPDELAVRFHHRLVSIHLFPNGNGRHARIMADLIVEKIYNRKPFSWGSTDLSKRSTNRKRYSEALRQADHNDFKELLVFARS
jgi:Fic-DOC domain mobile mystery protein B